MGGGVCGPGEPALLEREAQLAALREARRVVLDGGAGALVVLAGEAGSGKTALLRCFREETGRVLWGGCDPLFTPRPLGPFADVADQVGGELAELLNRGSKPHEVAAAVMDEARAGRGTVLVCEDLHWADEATLDVLSLARPPGRVGPAPARADLPGRRAGPAPSTSDSAGRPAANSAVADRAAVAGRGRHAGRGVGRGRAAPDHRRQPVLRQRSRRGR
jgi:hypothetical protein